METDDYFLTQGTNGLTWEIQISQTNEMRELSADLTVSTNEIGT